MDAAGGELLIPTIVLLYGVDFTIAGSLSLATSLPTMMVAFSATTETRASGSCGEPLVRAGDVGRVGRRRLDRGLVLGVVPSAVPSAVLIPLLLVLLLASSVKV